MFEFFDWLAHWFTVDLYDMIVQAFAYFVEVMTLFTIQSAISTITFAWDVAQQIMADLGVSAMIANMYSGFSGQILDLALWFRLPEITNTILGSYVTRYILSWIPGAKF